MGFQRVQAKRDTNVVAATAAVNRLDSDADVASVAEGVRVQGPAPH